MSEVKKSNEMKSSPSLKHSAGDKKAVKKARIAAELLATEESYVQSLELIATLYIEPIENANKAGSPIISKEKFDLVFSNISLIINLHRTFLKDLQASPTRPGSVLVRYANFFKMYTVYVNNQTFQTEILQTLLTRRKYNVFQELENSARTDKSNVKQHRLSSLLIMPIQRIPRYRLLLVELIKNTSDNDSDYNNLNKALELVESVATSINETLRKHEQGIEGQQLQSMFYDNEGKSSLEFNINRMFIRRGFVRIGKRDIKDIPDDDEESELFLFNDIFIEASREPLAKREQRQEKKVRREETDVCEKYYTIRSFPVDASKGLRVQDCTYKKAKDNKEENVYVFKLFQGRRSLIIFVHTEEDKNDWIHVIDSLLLHQYSVNLFQAAIRGELDVVENIIKMKRDITITDDLGWNALMRACKYGHLDIVNALLTAGTNINAVNKRGATTLMIACESNHLNIIPVLLDHKADIGFVDLEGRSAFDVGPTLLQYLNSCDNNDHQLNALAAACYLRHYQSILSLLQLDVKPQYATYQGIPSICLVLSPLEVQTLEPFKELLEAGADIECKNDKGQTPLLIIASQLFNKSDSDVVALLPILSFVVEAGASFSATDNDGNSIFCYLANPHIENFIFSNLAFSSSLLLAANKLNELNEKLIKKFLESHIFDKFDDGWNSIHQATLNGKLDLLILFDKIGLDLSILTTSSGVSSRIASHSSILHIAAVYNYRDIIRFILSSSSDFPNRPRSLDSISLSKMMTSQNDNSQTPFDINHNIIEIFTSSKITSGVAIDFSSSIDHSSCQLALSASCILGNVEVCAALLNTGKVNVQSRNADGEDPISLAAVHAHKEILMLIMQSQKNINLREYRNIHSQSLLHIGAEYHHDDLMKWLFQIGVDFSIKDNDNRFFFDMTADDVYKAKMIKMLETEHDNAKSKNDQQLASKIRNVLANSGETISSSLGTPSEINENYFPTMNNKSKTNTNTLKKTEEGNEYPCIIS